jgi:hypothetical protein
VVEDVERGAVLVEDAGNTSDDVKNYYGTLNQDRSSTIGVLD